MVKGKFTRKESKGINLNYMGIKDILVYSILKIGNFIIDSVHNFIYEL